MYPGVKVILVLIALLICTQMSTVTSQCNICSVYSNIACVSTTEFQVCIGGTPAGNALSCPNGYVCSSLNSTFCQPNVSGVVVSCGDCNMCDVNSIFACTGTQSYALCLGTNTPSSSATGSCGVDAYCNIEYPQICANISTGIPPTCSTGGGQSTTTTVSPITSPQTYCSSKQVYGRFPVGQNINTTCKHVWSGQLYTCPGQTFFNSTTQLCGANIPSDCSYGYGTTTLGWDFN